MVKVPVSADKLARIRDAAEVYVCNGGGIVPNHDADWQEPIIELANNTFGFKKHLADLNRRIDGLKLEADAGDAMDAAVVDVYDTMLTTGFMFGCMVGLALAGKVGAR